MNFQSQEQSKPQDNSSPFNISPFRSMVANDNPLKRKPETAGNDGSKAREFRRELNGRHGIATQQISMPPPPSRQASNIPQNPMLQHGNDTFTSRGNYDNPFQGSQNQGIDFQRYQPHQRSDDRPFSLSTHREVSRSAHQIPAQTPRQSFLPRQDGAPRYFDNNQPFLTPLPQLGSYNSRTSHQDGRISYLSPPTSRPGPRLNTNGSPLQHRGRLSLVPSAGPRLPGETLTNPGNENVVNSPYFPRPSTVSNVSNIFGAQFLDRPQTLRPSTVRRGGLGQLLGGGGNYMDQRGLRRTVRRD